MEQFCFAKPVEGVGYSILDLSMSRLLKTVEARGINREYTRMGFPCSLVVGKLKSGAGTQVSLAEKMAYSVLYILYKYAVPTSFRVVS